MKRIVTKVYFTKLYFPYVKKKIYILLKINQKRRMSTKLINNLNFKLYDNYLTMQQS